MSLTILLTILLTTIPLNSVGNGNLSTPPRFARRDTKEGDATTPSATKPGARLPCR